MPEHRVGIVNEIRKIFYPTAMIDISDGLGRDLYRLCSASKCGCLLEEKSIPLPSGLKAFAGERSLEYALSSGEEYELLFSSERDRVDGYSGDVPVHRIGRVTEKDIRIQNNNTIVDLPATGYDHFMKG
jgi:thiamine-monophosphate kinase